MDKSLERRKKEEIRREISAAKNKFDIGGDSFMDFAFEKREKEEGYGNLGGSNVTNQSQILREMLSDAEINSDAESRHASNRKIALQKREDTNQKQAKIAYLK